MTTVHIPILVEPILKALVEPFLVLPVDSPPHYMVDCTLGGGGHTAAFLSAFETEPKLTRHKVLAFDQDLQAIEKARLRFAQEIQNGKLELIHARFSETARHLEGKPVFGLMADLGFSSDQLEDSSRGLSFMADGTLDMRLDPTRGMNCRDYLAQVSEAELEQVLRDFGEERFSRRIASAIVRRRQEGCDLATTKDLRELVVRAIPAGARHGRIHAATRTFQALRIAVNQELEELDCLLNRVILNVKLGGRVAIISFHSLEDRKVKHAFRSLDAFKPLTKKPIEASDEEIARNPRSRSAKLRIAERVSSSKPSGDLS